jgi:glutathione S-transferase
MFAVRKLLYSRGSPYARRTRIVLMEKALAFESDIYDAVRPIELIQPHNPALQVPVLYDGDQRLFGSNLISEYLYNVYPAIKSEDAPPLAPTITRLERHWEDKLILTVIEAVADSIVAVRLIQMDVDTVPFIGRLKARITSCLDWLEQRVNGEGFWPGTFSLFDINLLCPLLYGEKREVFEFRLDRWPKIVSMVDRWQDRPSVASTHPDQS